MTIDVCPLGLDANSIVPAAPATSACAVFDFAVLPPEINSGRMYNGPGSGPLLAAASAWDALATELGTAASRYSSVIAELTGMPWVGPASTAMLAAITPFVSWLSATAAQSEQTGMQARAAAAAFETAFAMTVPPPAIAANRVLLMALIATNFFGQNMPAIAATESQYAEFWAQDATAMGDYASSSAIASVFTPFGPPPATTNPDGLVEQAAAVGQAAAAAAPLKPFPILPTIDWNALVNTWGLAYFGMGIIQLGTMFAQQLMSEPAAAVGASEAALGPALAPALSRLASAPMSVGLGQAGRVGPMSVPPSWATSPAALNAGSAGISDVAAPATPASTGRLLPGVPMRTGGRAGSLGRRRYGVRPRVIVRPPAAG